jgi:hypothetical protein
MSLPARAAGPGGWEHLGDGGAVGTPSLKGPVYALNTERPGKLYAGGNFTNAGGHVDADRIASWDGSAWSAVSSPTSQIENGTVNAIAYDNVTGKVYAGGTFINAGGNPNADFLAAWNGTSWQPFCNGTVGPPITATVYALQIIGRTLYIAGAFENGAGIKSADRLVACNLDTGASSSTVIDEAHEFSGTVYALTADADGTLYAGGGFTDLGKDPAADNVAYLDSDGWHAMGSGAAACGCAVDDFVRSLTAIGTDVYIGTDAKNVAGIAQADHVARWNGSAWSATGSNTAGTDGWFPESAFIYAMANDGRSVYATGSFQNADGDPTADFIASFDGGAWHPVGSDGAGNGPWGGNGLSLASFDGRLVAGGNFTSAGGDTQAQYLASYAGQVRLTISFVGNGNGRVYTNDGIQCSTTCSISYPAGTTVTVDPVYVSGSEFSGWMNGGVCSVLEECKVTLSTDTTVVPRFDLRPVCADRSVNIDNASTATVQLSCTDPEGRPFIGYYVNLKSDSDHGSIGGRASDGLVSSGKLTYTPNPGYVGQDTVDYIGEFTHPFTAFSAINFAKITFNITDKTKPQIRELGLSRSAFRAAVSGASTSAAKIGTEVSFSVAEPSSVKFSVQRPGKGRKVGRKCAKPTFLNSSKKACVRLTPLKGSFKITAKTGLNKFRFRGRIGGRTIAPGSYRLGARATDLSKNVSSPEAVAFKIVP